MKSQFSVEFWPRLRNCCWRWGSKSKAAMAAAAGGALSMFSVVEDVLQQHGTRIGDLDLVESRKAEQAGT